MNAAAAGGRRAPSFGSLLAPGTLVVLAPHPDDETLGAGGLIAHALDAGRRVLVVLLTDGAGSHPAMEAGALARRRLAELALALRRLGRPAPQLVSLGLADGRLEAVSDKAFERVRGLLRGIDAGTLVVPDAGDGHPDHRAAFRLGVRLWAGRAVRALVAMPISQRLDGRAVHDAMRIVLPPALRRRKAHALAAHRSQLGIDIGRGYRLPAQRLPVMLAEEVYRPLAGVATGAHGGRAHFDRLFLASDDPWRFRSDPLEAGRFDAIERLLPGALGELWEAGCANGALTARLAPRADRVVATELSPIAAVHARRALVRWPRVEVVEQALPDVPAGRFDTLVWSDCLYYISLADLVRLVPRAVGCWRPGGRLLMGQWLGPTGEPMSGETAAEAALALLALHGARRVGGLRTDRYRLDLVMAAR